MNKEHYDLMSAFERQHSGRFDKEDKSLWPRGIIYQDGAVNELFASFRRGHAYAQADARSDIQGLEAARDGYRNDAKALHEALERMALLYESEYDDIEGRRPSRPQWLIDALARRNALEGDSQ